MSIKTIIKLVAIFACILSSIGCGMISIGDEKSMNNGLFLVSIGIGLNTVVMIILTDIVL